MQHNIPCKITGAGLGGMCIAFINKEDELYPSKKLKFLKVTNKFFREKRLLFYNFLIIECKFFIHSTFFYT